MAEPTAPASVHLRELVLAAVADLVVLKEIKSAALDDLVACAHRTGLCRAQWTRHVVPAAVEPHSEDEPLGLLWRTLRLTPLELMTLALLVAVDEDALMGRAIAELQQPIAGSRPSLGFVSVALGPLVPAERPVHSVLTGTALASGVMAVSANDRPLAERVLSLPTPISLALRGHDGMWPGMSVGAATASKLMLADSVVTEAERQGRALLQGERALLIRTRSAVEGRAVASRVALTVGCRPVFIEGDVVEGLGPWMKLRQLVPVFCFDLGPGEHKRLPPLRYHDGPVLVVTGPDGSIDTNGVGIPEWTLGVPSSAERATLWSCAIGPGKLARELADEHRHGAGRIASLGRLARHLMLVDGSRHLERAHVQAAAWLDEEFGLASLAQPLRAAVPDDALVTTSTLRTELDHLVLRCRARDGLDQELGASVRARYAPGVRALFVGPSGTGKTLAAGWLATRLGMPLYRVDLAAVTSKYIGETEKNLARLLGRAEHADVVLLFDEADSMFGKRTDVKEANDRFANAQTNYLLQRIESFDGIAILTSNSLSRLDSAFIRRLDAVLEFALPGPEERRNLWLSHLGTRHCLSTRSINRLAVSLDLAGGHIRNVVLVAAVLARADGRMIAYADVMAGLAAEYRKLGRQVPEALRTES